MFKNIIYWNIVTDDFIFSPKIFNIGFQIYESFFIDFISYYRINQVKINFFLF
jgi:hypothetical protein